MEYQPSTAWCDADAALMMGDEEGDGTAGVAAARLLHEMEESRPELYQEVTMVIAVYECDGRIQLKKDRHGRYLMKVAVPTSVRGHTVHALVTITIPDLYPDAGHALEISIVTDRASDKNFTMQLLGDVRTMAETMGADGMPSLFPVLGQVADTISHMPVDTYADVYCCCTDCNTRLMNLKAEKVPQPAVRGDDGVYRCLRCGALSITVIPSLYGVPEEKMDDSLCSFCFCGDSPMLKVPKCGDISCFSCFVTFCELAVGSKSLRKAVPKKLDEEPWKKKWKITTANAKLPLPVGIPCPNHKDCDEALIVDSGLIKLLPTRTYNRYNFFAMETALSKIEGRPAVACPSPTCFAYPFVSTQSGGMTMCPMCGEFFCPTCDQMSAECECVEFNFPNDEPCNRVLKRFGDDWVRGPSGEYIRYGGEEEVEWLPKLLECGVIPETKIISSPGGASCSSGEDMLTVLVTLRNRQLPVKLPNTCFQPHPSVQSTKKEIGWYTTLANFVVYSDLVPYYNTHRSRLDSVFIVVFNGSFLDKRLSLQSQGVYTGAVLFVLEFFELTSLYMEERSAELMKQVDKIKPMEHIVDPNRKKCPECRKPVVHYLGHGCHMISGCHRGNEWCYVCETVAESHMCKRGCKLFCTFEYSTVDGVLELTDRSCTCPLCPDCKPMRPCDQCTGCPCCRLSTRAQ